MDLQNITTRRDGSGTAILQAEATVTNTIVISADQVQAQLNEAQTRVDYLTQLLTVIQGPIITDPIDSLGDAVQAVRSLAGAIQSKENI